MPANPSGTISGSQDRLSNYRRSQRALTLAAAEAADGHVDGRVEAALAANGYGHVFPDRAALAAAAQSQWWQRLLGRLDALLDDDLAGIPGDAMTSAIQAAWTATVHDLPGYLALAASAGGSAAVRRGTLRYARLLALFAGRADIDEDPVIAARAGLALVEALSSAATSTATHSAANTAAFATATVNIAAAAGAAVFRPLVRVRRALTLSR